MSRSNAATRNASVPATVSSTARTTSSTTVFIFPSGGPASRGPPYCSASQCRLKPAPTYLFTSVPTEVDTHTCSGKRPEHGDGQLQQRRDQPERHGRQRVPRVARP